MSPADRQRSARAAFWGEDGGCVGDNTDVPGFLPRSTTSGAAGPCGARHRGRRAAVGAARERNVAVWWRRDPPIGDADSRWTVSQGVRSAATPTARS
jgi:hypothetical protein